MEDKNTKNILESIFGNHKKKKEINTDILKVKGNSIYYSDNEDTKTALQISNIAQIDAGPAPKEKIPFITYILLLAGLYLIPNKGGFMYGVLLIAAGSFIIYWILTINSKAGDNLIFHLNNGKYYMFNFKDKAFLNEVFQVLLDCITQEENREMTISIHNSTINSVSTGDNSVVGEGNVLQGSSLGGENNKSVYTNSVSEIDWERLRESLLEVMKRLPADTAEYEAGSQLLGSVLKKDEAAFFQIVKKFSLAFTSSLFTNTASQFLITFISKMLDK